MDEITARTRDAVVVIVTNPLDVLTYFAIERSGLPRGRVFGSGTVLDSARFKYLLGCHYRVDPRSVHAFACGERGERVGYSARHVPRAFETRGRRAAAIRACAAQDNRGGRGR